MSTSAPFYNVSATTVLPVSRAGRRLGLGLMVASGFAALGYQIVWTQQSALWLGHESAAVLAVVAAFFGGIALGSLLFGPRIDRSPMPARWYAACEAAIAAWSVMLAFTMGPVSRGFLDLIGEQPSPLWHWSVAFCGTFLLLLPATAAMGATLPAMERVLAAMRDRGASIAALYAGNTFGAVLGVCGVAFILVPNFGLRATAAVCAGLNLLCAAFASRLVHAPSESVTPSRSHARGMLSTLAATGLLGIGYEVLVVRVLSQVAENTVYTFAILLAVYLVGTAAGAAAYARWLANRDDREQCRDRLLQGLAACLVIGVLILANAASLKASMLRLTAPSTSVALAAEAALALSTFLVPTILMGALFSHLSMNARDAGIAFGRALGINTLGATAAPLLFGVVLLPSVGSKLALVSIAIGYLALTTGRAWSRPIHLTLVAALLACALWAPPLRIVDVPPDGRLLDYAEGTTASVSVIEDASGVRRLHIDNHQQEGSSATLYADARQALLPVLLHPSPRRVLFLGLGTGVTASSATEDPRLDVDAVELLPEVVAASRYFRSDSIERERASRLHMKVADARRFVLVAHERYDLIVSDNFHPARSGSGALYTVEHFQATRGRLAPGGMFCQWLPLHQLDLDTLRSIVRSFLAAYPQGWALLATNSLDTPVVGLIARADEARVDSDQIRARLGAAPLSSDPAEFGLADDVALLGNFIAGPRALARFAHAAPMNTDDRPIVAYRAPRITYAPDSLPRDRLIALLDELSIEPREWVTSTGDPALAARLLAYWTARDRFIELGSRVEPTADVRHMLAQVRAPFLEILKLSPDFRPAYDPLLRMAIALGQVDAGAARELLNELQRVQPARPEAAAALRALPPDA